MFKRAINIIAPLIALALLISCAERGEKDTAASGDAPDVIATATVNTVEGMIGDIIKLDIEVSAKPGINVSLPSPAKDIGDLKIIDSGVVEPKQLDDRVIVSKWYKLQAAQVGSYIIPELTVGCVYDNGDADNVTTEEIYITIKSAIAEGEEFEDIIDIKPLVDVKAGISVAAAAIIASVVVIILVVAVALLYYRKRRRAECLMIIPAHELAFKELDALKGSTLLASRNVKLYHFRLSEIFRKYMEQRYSFNASEWTTEEILPYTAKELELDDVLIGLATSVLRNTDLVKFTDFVPDDKESSLELSRAYKFVDQTMVKEEDVSI